MKKILSLACFMVLAAAFAVTIGCEDKKSTGGATTKGSTPSSMPAPGTSK